MSSPARRRWPRVLLGVALFLALTLVAAGLWLRSALDASLPRLDGEVPVTGLAGDVELERDAHGIVTVRGTTRLDVAQGLGFAHAQDRFFQMDLLRRSGAGELAELIGAPVLEEDRRHRLHRFRDVARRSLEASPPAEQELLHAYAEGVNAGLASLGRAPFEYLALRVDPVPWLAEDALLVVLAMFFDLQDSTGAYDTAVGEVHAVLPPALAAFLTPWGSEWDAPLDGGTVEPVPIPGPEVVDLRASRAAAAMATPPLAGQEASTSHGKFAGGWVSLEAGLQVPDSEASLRNIVGSNNYVVAGSRTADGAPLVANDPHLGLRVPNIWYRAVLEWPGDDGQPLRVAGVSLPGTPGITIGSNGHVAWGFTNSYGDYTDVVLLELDPTDPGRYLTAEGYRPFEVVEEAIRVKGQADQTLAVQRTIWGPVLPPDGLGRPRALAWTAHDPGAVNAGFVLRMESLRSVGEALELAPSCGIPAQNLVVADRDGHIAWTIIGRIPRRVGFDGRTPVSWADGTRRWDGWVTPAEVPRVVDPPDGALWTANSRVVSGEALRAIGDGGYDLGARGGQIRDQLRRLERASAADVQAVALDDRALFLERWRDLLLAELTPETIAASPSRAELRRLVETSWSGRASADARGYRLVRAFRYAVADVVMAALTAPVKERDAGFRWERLAQEEAVVWPLVSTRPAHLVPPPHADWTAALLAGVDLAIGRLAESCPTLADCSWGARNTVAIQHPLSLAVPALGRFLDMVREPLPGDDHMPRVQSPTFGASMRMVVSPGREADGLLHMPAGQSGHPRSPFYADQHREWATGSSAPFMPGPRAHRLLLLGRGPERSTSGAASAQ